MSFSMTCTTLNPSLTRIPSDKLNPSDNLLILPPQFPIPQLSELIFKISNMVVSYDYCHLKILKNFLHWSWHSIERNLIFSLTLRILVQAYMYTNLTAHLPHNQVAVQVSEAFTTNKGLSVDPHRKASLQANPVCVYKWIDTTTYE